jgi:hypothetical protein
VAVVAMGPRAQWVVAAGCTRARGWQCCAC